MTIYALSTVPGKSGVAVIRVSGQLAKVAIKKLTKKALKPREATLCKLYDHKDSVFDQAVVVFFEDKKSFTGCLLYTSPSPRDYAASRMPSSA